MESTREAVQDRIGLRVTSMKQLLELDPDNPQAGYYKGFIEGVAQLAGLMVEPAANETQRRHFLADCGFPCEQEVK